MKRKATKWVPSEEDIQVFTEGGCPWLAIALHEETGWPLALLIDEAHQEDWAGEELPLIAHVVVLTPRNTAIDIYGETSIADLKKRYHDLREPRLEEVSRNELERLMADDKPLEACPSEYAGDLRMLARKILRAVK
jgi:hypothetical protein